VRGARRQESEDRIQKPGDTSQEPEEGNPRIEEGRQKSKKQWRVAREENPRMEARGSRIEKTEEFRISNCEFGKENTADRRQKRNFELRISNLQRKHSRQKSEGEQQVSGVRFQVLGKA